MGRPNPANTHPAVQSALSLQQSASVKRLSQLSESRVTAPQPVEVSALANLCVYPSVMVDIADCMMIWVWKSLIGLLVSLLLDYWACWRLWLHLLCCFGCVCVWHWCVMLLFDTAVWYWYMMLWCNVWMRCWYVVFVCDIGIWCCYVTLRCDVVMWRCHASCYVTWLCDVAAKQGPGVPVAQVAHDTGDVWASKGRLWGDMHCPHIVEWLVSMLRC